MNILKILADSLVIAGICVLIVALIPIRQLMQLVSGRVRRRWYILTALIVFFIVGYTIYTVVFWNRHTNWQNLLVPGVFFFGASFVWLINNLSFQTATDVRHVTLLERENITDPLIGIYNRRYLDRQVVKEFARARRYALPLAVLLLDIDHFKQVNDTYGHPVGDLVLIHMGKLILIAIRDTDIATRYGGEEFLVIAPNTTVSSAAALAERLRQYVETHELLLSSEPNNRQNINVTVSIGVADIGQKVPDSHSLIRNADEALYRAKQEGRNRVIIYNSNIPKGTHPQPREPHAHNY